MTNQNDGSTREAPGTPKAPRWPTLKSAVARRVQHEPPRRFFDKGKEYVEREVIEIDVETDADFPVIGTGPVLFIGKLPLVDSQRIRERCYRFFAPGSVSLTKNAAVALGRGGTGVPVQEGKRRVRLQWEAGSAR
jgi:hypothetical protein